MLLLHPPSRAGLRATLQQARETYRRRGRAAAPRKPPPSRPLVAEPDVLLDVSRLKVDEVDLRIDALDARVALNAQILDLLRLDVGVDAQLRGVGLKIEGVDAQALLKVRLENLTAIVDRVLGTLDRHPEIVEQLTRGLAATLEHVGDGAGSAIADVGSLARAAGGKE
jgi:hypothetical protein